MIKWYHALYADETVKKKLNKIIDKIENEQLTFRVFCIALASNPQNMLDIIGANELLFKHYRQNEIYILGLAGTRTGAVSLVTQIIEEIYEKTNDVKIREYFKEEEFSIR